MERKRWYLIHAYGDYERRGTKADVDGCIQVLAAAELWREDRGENIGGFVFDTAVPYKSSTLAENMATNLRGLIPSIPEESVIVNPVATTTRTEISNFKKIAEEHGFTNIFSIGRPWHLERIAIAAQREFGTTIPIFSSDEILKQANPQRYSPIIESWNKKTLDGYKRREVIIQLVNKIPFTNGQILEKLDKLLGNKALEFWAGKVLGRK